MKNLCIDIETYSSINLVKSGVYRYTEAPEFEILLFGYSIDGGPVKVIDLVSGEELPGEIRQALLDDTVIKWAHNAQFERVILSRYLGEWLKPDSWRCTMVWAAYLGLPLSLEGAAVVTGAEKQKLTEGKELIRYFCMPCRPTKTNGGRCRNLPGHAPEKWEQFKVYNTRDVETEMALMAKLQGFPVPDDEWQNYILDQEINDRGIMLDMALVRQAIGCDARSRETLTRHMQEITALDNPNSVAQMKAWLADHGLETESLDKAAVRELLQTAPIKLGQVLELRQQLSKSSVKKYTAMANAVCSDGRARGLIQFYGANRTGRFSGRLIQVQNLPANHISDLEQARSLVSSGNLEALDILYDSVPATLSELIRTAFIPKPGCKFLVADFSAIEARVIAWLAGETWKMDVIAGDGKIYEATAARMFNVPIESVTKGSALRQKAKQSELACIAEGQLVLTDQGLVPIELVTLHHRLWDGETWVSHAGFISKGIREVIEYDGLCATPDHLVWIEGSSEPVQFGFASTGRACLLQTGNGRKEIRLGDYNKHRKTVEQCLESVLCPHPVQRLRQHSMAELDQFDSRKIGRLPKLLSTPANSILVGSEAYSRQATLRKPRRSWIPQLRGTWNSLGIQLCIGGGSMDPGELPRTVSGFGNRPHRQQQGLRTRQYSPCSSYCEPEQQANCGFDPVGAEILAILSECCDQKTIKRNYPQGSNPICRDGCVREKEKLAINRSPARVYDIRNAGRHHRFTVSGKLVHNCGYGGSVGALKAMGALEMGLSEDELQPLVTAWRQANPNIVRLWWALDRAAKTAVKEQTTAATHGIRFEYRSGMLFITLPSGRKLSYVKPRMGENRFGSESVTYEGIGANKKWERIETFGGKLAENIVQAISRDLLCYAMRRIDAAGYPIVMHVHDEIVIEAPLHTSVEHICELMGDTPPWAPGLILRADGFECGFYKKD